MKLTDSNLAKAKKKLAMLDGKPPYDGPANPCRGDGYFVLSIEREFGMSIKELRAKVKEQED